MTTIHKNRILSDDSVNTHTAAATVNYQTSPMAMTPNLTLLGMVAANVVASGISRSPSRFLCKRFNCRKTVSIL